MSDKPKPIHQPSADALRRADEFLDELEDKTCDEYRAPCLRDDLADNRGWLRVKVAQMIDEVSDGRPLYTQP